MKKNCLSYFAKIIEIAFKLEFKGLIDGLAIEAFLKSWKMGGFQLNFFASRESWWKIMVAVNRMLAHCAFVRRRARGSHETSGFRLFTLLTDHLRYIQTSLRTSQKCITSSWSNFVGWNDIYLEKKMKKISVNTPLT